MEVIIERVARNPTHFLIFYLTLVVFTTSHIKTAASASRKNDTTFVKTACSSTTYPPLCFKSLSSYASAIKANPFKLCTTALTLNLETAKSASSFVSELLEKSQTKQSPETQALNDCVEEIGDAVDELKKAIAEMRKIAGGRGGERITNVKTWVSAAMTDEDTCTDGFDEVNRVNAKTKKKIKNTVVNLSRMTSNSLALISALRY